MEVSDGVEKRREYEVTQAVLKENPIYATQSLKSQKLVMQRWVQGTIKSILLLFNQVGKLTTTMQAKLPWPVFWPRLTNKLINSSF